MVLRNRTNLRSGALAQRLAMLRQRAPAGRAAAPAGRAVPGLPGLHFGSDFGANMRTAARSSAQFHSGDLRQMEAHPAVGWSRGMAGIGGGGLGQSSINSLVDAKLGEQGIFRDESGTWHIDFAQNQAYRDAQRGGGMARPGVSSVLSGRMQEITPGTVGRGGPITPVNASPPVTQPPTARPGTIGAGTGTGPVIGTGGGATDVQTPATGTLPTTTDPRTTTPAQPAPRTIGRGSIGATPPDVVGAGTGQTDIQNPATATMPPAGPVGATSTRQPGAPVIATPEGMLAGGQVRPTDATGHPAGGLGGVQTNQQAPPPAQPGQNGLSAGWPPMGPGPGEIGPGETSTGGKPQGPYDTALTPSANRTPGPPINTTIKPLDAPAPPPTITLNPDGTATTTQRTGGTIAGMDAALHPQQGFEYFQAPPQDSIGRGSIGATQPDVVGAGSGQADINNPATASGGQITPGMTNVLPGSAVPPGGVPIPVPSQPTPTGGAPPGAPAPPPDRETHPGPIRPVPQDQVGTAPAPPPQEAPPRQLPSAPGPATTPTVPAGSLPGATTPTRPGDLPSVFGANFPFGDRGAPSAQGIADTVRQRIAGRQAGQVSPVTGPNLAGLEGLGDRIRAAVQGATGDIGIASPGAGGTALGPATTSIMDTVRAQLAKAGVGQAAGPAPTSPVSTGQNYAQPAGHLAGAEGVVAPAPTSGGGDYSRAADMIIQQETGGQDLTGQTNCSIRPQSGCLALNSGIFESTAQSLGLDFNRIVNDPAYAHQAVQTLLASYADDDASQWGGPAGMTVAEYGNQYLPGGADEAIARIYFGGDITGQFVDEQGRSGVEYGQQFVAKMGGSSPGFSQPGGTGAAMGLQYGGGTWDPNTGQFYPPTEPGMYDDTGTVITPQNATPLGPLGDNPQGTTLPPGVILGQMSQANQPPGLKGLFGGGEATGPTPVANMQYLTDDSPFPPGPSDTTYEFPPGSPFADPTLAQTDWTQEAQRFAAPESGQPVYQTDAQGVVTNATKPEMDVVYSTQGTNWPKDPATGQPLATNAFNEATGPFDPQFIVYHTLETDTFTGAATYDHNADGTPDGSTNYVIDRDGTVHEVVPPGSAMPWANGQTQGLAGVNPEKQLVYDAVSADPTGEQGGNLNAKSISIEFAGHAADGGVTPEQMAAGQALTAYLSQQYGIPLDDQHLVSHSDIAGDQSLPEARSDPGFDVMTLAPTGTGAAPPREIPATLPDEAPATTITPGGEVAPAGTALAAPTGTGTDTRIAPNAGGITWNWEDVNRYDQTFAAEGQKWGVSPAVLKSIAIAETQGTLPNALMQVQPQWANQAASLGYDINTPEGQIGFAAYMLGSNDGAMSPGRDWETNFRTNYFNAPEDLSGNGTTQDNYVQFITDMSGQLSQGQPSSMPPINMADVAGQTGLAPMPPINMADVPNQTGLSPFPVPGTATTPLQPGNGTVVATDEGDLVIENPSTGPQPGPTGGVYNTIAEPAADPAGQPMLAPSGEIVASVTPESTGWAEALVPGGQEALLDGGYTFGEDQGIIAYGDYDNWNCATCHTGDDVSTNGSVPFKVLQEGTVVCAGSGSYSNGQGGAIGCEAYDDEGGGVGQITVATDDGALITYGHARTTNFDVGQRVTAGQVLGTSGFAGGGYHIHAEVQLPIGPGGSYVLVDPSEYYAGYYCSMGFCPS